MTLPRATYRLQFNRDFTFADANALVDYLGDLGISHLYASPFLDARPGSTHGYDIIDHNRINPEIGAMEDLADLTDRLKLRGMGLVLDFVPNHMGVGGKDNAWWLDVLEWGRASPYAEFFDINWQAGRPDLTGKILLPVLGDQYGAILEKGEIELRFDPAEGSFSAWYWDHRFPISPRRYAAILRRADPPAEEGEELRQLADAFAKLREARGRRGRFKLHAEGMQLKARLADLAQRKPWVNEALQRAAARFAGEVGKPETWRALHALLEAQAYRIAYWRVAADEINYRRFFNINDLAGIRIELPELFERAHRLVLTLIAEGRLQGLRIDHIDGLFDPAAYCDRLQQEAAAAATLPAGAFYIVVEKILAAHEALPDWPVAGTTGYDFIREVGGLFIDPAGEAPLTRAYRRFTGRSGDFAAALYQGKRRITEVNLASETNVLASEFHALSRSHWRSRDFTLNGMRGALDEVIAAFPVYRTYVSAEGARPEDRRFIEWSIGLAKRRWPGADTSIFDFIAGVLTGDLARRGSGYSRAQVLRLAMRFQQITGPVMAKGAEDTAFYRYVRLLALNEVGGDPGRFGLSVQAFHRAAELRAKRWPRGMLTSSTHDTKRGEDARARLALLSEVPRDWERRVMLWARLNRFRRGEVDGNPAPDRNDEYFFYQTVLGAWPLDLQPDDAAALAAFAERVGRTMTKAVREAKEHSSWSNPNAEYEAVLGRFVMGALDGSRPNPFLQDMHGFVERLARPGALNSLAQTLIKLTAPGVPDTYQGGELWDFSMVDPDNRRPVEWSARRRLLDELRERFGDGPVDRQAFAEMAAHWRDGREKLFLIWRALALRAAMPAAFAGAYVPLAARGRHADQLCAFARLADGQAAVAVAPRLVMPLLGNGAGIDWADTAVVLPEGRAWRDVLTGRELAVQEGALAVGTLLADFPVALIAAT
ncbi:MAG TPA: malto-oligosyltrehalose synthase [Stellaceae bacterium]|nr:malto-oligosyltrehalose synthase [Stellaceae bacterium]